MKTTQKAGRKLKYGEPTTLMRVPNSMVDIVNEMIKKREILETQWQEKLIGQDAQRLVELITELMITPQKGLIKALEESGLSGFHEEVKKLNEGLEDTRKACRGLTVTALLEVITEEM